MNINHLPSPGSFSGCIKLNKEVAQAISSVEIQHNWGSIKEAKQLRDYFKFCTDFLDDTILKDVEKDDKKKSGKKPDKQ